MDKSSLRLVFAVLVYSVLCVATWIIFLYHRKKGRFPFLNWLAVVSATIGLFVMLWAAIGTICVALSGLYTKMVFLACLLCFFHWLVLPFWYKEFFLDYFKSSKNPKHFVVLSIRSYRINLWHVLWFTSVLTYVFLVCGTVVVWTFK